jgi:predicted regulator of Ras-like GTPase activity (Roadblock/LC7/MglB family)
MSDWAIADFDFFSASVLWRCTGIFEELICGRIRRLFTELCKCLNYEATTYTGLSDTIKRLKKLVESGLDSNVEVVMLMDRYGILLASADVQGTSRDMIAKICSVIMGSLERLGQIGYLGVVKHVSVNYGSYSLVMVNTDKAYILAALTKGNTKETLDKLFKLADAL